MRRKEAKSYWSAPELLFKELCLDFPLKAFLNHCFDDLNTNRDQYTVENEENLGKYKVELEKGQRN